MRKRIVRLLLAALNSRWLNRTPCQYGFIGNVDAFALHHLRSEESQRPGITVATIIREAEEFNSCVLRNDGPVVLEGGVTRQATVWDLRELEQMGTNPGGLDDLLQELEPGKNLTAMREDLLADIRALRIVVHGKPPAYIAELRRMLQEQPVRK